MSNVSVEVVELSSLRAWSMGVGNGADEFRDGSGRSTLPVAMLDRGKEARLGMRGWRKNDLKQLVRWRRLQSLIRLMKAAARVSSRARRGRTPLTRLGPCCKAVFVKFSREAMLDTLSLF